MDALLCPARAETVFTSTPAISCSVIFVWRSECNDTFGKPTLTNIFCSHTLNSPGEIVLSSSVQNNLSVSFQRSPRYCFWLSYCFISLTGINIFASVLLASSKSAPPRSIIPTTSHLPLSTGPPLAPVIIYLSIVK